MFVNPENVLSNFDVGPGMKVADLGAGSGFYTIESARRVTNAGRVYAVDIQKDLLDRIKTSATSEKLSNIEIIWGDIEKLGGTKLREGLCDRVVASNIFSQVDHKDDFCLEIKRILKPGGKVLIIDWSEGLPLGPKNFIKREDVESIFKRSGFIFEKNVPAGDVHYGLIFKRQ